MVLTDAGERLVPVALDAVRAFDAVRERIGAEPGWPVAPRGDRRVFRVGLHPGRHGALDLTDPVVNGFRRRRPDRCAVARRHDRESPEAEEFAAVAVDTARTLVPHMAGVHPAC